MTGELVEDTKVHVSDSEVHSELEEEPETATGVQDDGAREPIGWEAFKLYADAECDKRLKDYVANKEATASTRPFGYHPTTMCKQRISKECPCSTTSRRDLSTTRGSP